MKRKHIFYFLIFLLAVYLFRLEAAANGLNIGFKSASKPTFKQGIIKFTVNLTVTNPNLISIPVRSIAAANYLDTAILGVSYLTKSTWIKSGGTTILPVTVEIPFSDLPAAGAEILDGIKTFRFKGNIKSLGVNFPFDEKIPFPKLF